MKINLYTAEQIKKMSSVRLGVLYRKLSFFDPDEEITSQLEMIIMRLSQRSMDKRRFLMKECQKDLGRAKEYYQRVRRMYDEFFRRVYD